MHGTMKLKKNLNLRYWGSFPWIKGLRHEPDLSLSSGMNEWSYASTPTRRVLLL
jgi:hypothetical protein